MNFINGYLNRKFRKARLEKYLREKELEYKLNVMIENNNSIKKGSN